ncbi:DUF1259 domain-containing protein [Candidatus Acetothermia bacterium]|nr:DUF1259 domain-containing protein [Candidatus Acetothermia bacterium]MBI3642567.1 DUF1259 domain-containing protein [Candidatus Acetothermia bacterium]
MSNTLQWIAGLLIIVLLIVFGREHFSSTPAPAAATAPSHLIDWAPVEKAMGKAGAIQSDGVLKFGFPRTDLKVMIGDLQLKPTFALGGWVALKQMGDEAVLMGDLVLSEDELNPVMTALQQGGIDQTAIHNHLLGELPHVMYMHIYGHGDPVKMAESIHTALALTKIPLTPSNATSASGQDLGLDTKELDQILGHSGKVNNGVYQFSIPRAEKIMAHGFEIPPSMGVATAINFQATADGKAMITGDFVLIGSEVNSVLRALRENGIEVTALHSHMLSEEPRLFFMHFWASDDAQKLARGLHSALNQMNIK